MALVRRYRFRALLVICALGMGAPARAQPPSSAQAIESTNADESVASDSTSRAGSGAEKRSARQPGGGDAEIRDERKDHLTPVLLDKALLKEYLEWRAKKERGASAQLPPYSIASLTLDGEAEEQGAVLTATIEVDVHQEQGAVIVPLRMAEASPRKYTPDSRSAFVEDDENGLVWSFIGKGMHKLTFELFVPIRKELPVRRLQLSLPNTVVSRLTLRVPGPRIQPTLAKPDERTFLTSKSLGESKSEIVLNGLGSRVDLIWQPKPLISDETELQARTDIQMNFDGETVLLEAAQKIYALKGNFSELNIRLPVGYEILKLENPNVKAYRFDLNNPNQVLVDLKETVPHSGSIDLKWTLRSNVPIHEEKLVLDGFEVERAPYQQGSILLRLAGGYRIAKAEEHRFVKRSDINDPLPNGADRGAAASAYKFRQQPFLLQVQLQKVQPVSTVTPKFLLRLTVDRAELEGLFEYQVYPAGLEEVTFHWPNRKQEGWRLEVIDAVEPARLVDKMSVDDSSPGLIRVKLAERSQSEFKLRLRAQRVLEPSFEPVAFSFPVPQASNLLGAVLDVSPAENLEADFVPTGATNALPRGPALGDPAKGPGDPRRSSFLISSATQTFAATLTVHPQRVVTQTEFEVRTDGDQSIVTQRIAYDVSYERLSQVLLTVPAELNGRPLSVRSSDQNQEELPILPAGSSDEGLKRFRVRLERPRLGQFELIAQFELPRRDHPHDAPETISVPLIQSGDAPFSVTKFRAPETSNLGILSTDENWKRQPSQNGIASWTAEGDPAEVNLVSSPFPAEARPSITVTRILVRAVLDREGNARYFAQYRIAGRPTGLQILLPEGGRATRPNYWWGKQQITKPPVPVTGGDAQGPEYLALPETSSQENAATDEQLLTIYYQGKGGVPSGLNVACHLVAPRILGDNGMSETIWEVVLPHEQHLFFDPAGFIPLFRWEWTGLFWSRRADSSAAALDRWIVSTAGPAEPMLPGVGNVYRFSGFGDATRLDIQAMSRHIIFLIGGGAGLLIGFMLMYLPMTRHLLTILLLGFVIAGAALWYPEPVFVLLPPAGLGLLLVIASGSIQSLWRRSRAGRVLTLAPSSGFVAPSSSVRRELPGAVGAMESTSLRVPAEYTSDSGFKI